MPAFRFLHTSDLHLGKRFGTFEEEIRADLQQARLGIVATLARTAADHGAGHVLIAGDSFDTETPSQRLIRQTLATMGETSALHWWIIPGNHDSLGAELIWTVMQAHAPDNVHLLTDPAPTQIAPGVTLLPAPCPRRFPGTDLTAWMDGCETPQEHLRIGLAHGGVIDFGSDEPGGDIISPRRAETARLDYLALGDWHGIFTFDERTRYSGTPERDRFKHAGRGGCLLVDLPGPGAPPLVTEVETGKYNWQERTLRLTPGDDAAEALIRLLPHDRTDWRHTLLKITAEGWCHLPERLRLSRAAAEIAPEFCHFDLNDGPLQTEYSADDLDDIAQGGALRMAAETLRNDAENTDLARRDRDVSAAALNRLYGLVQEAAE
ncbi:Calcineurin-like phosphoesterase [Salinihabitans flavidus]|uniref:Calcineurin-like phosphoesterase n=1 Tax=Salinihabitans flavidus TaxID=569882 RepID=A0A1H8PJJ0_9RHOB|nr:metallophosphoesterase [Salinihabitans flavidus]SEO41874.1 Calcineurin-like phosphoesterase [Salinihabitans flavidus]